MRVTLKELRSLVRIETKKVLFENRTGAKTKKTSVLTKESINKMILEEIKKILKENKDPFEFAAALVNNLNNLKLDSTHSGFDIKEKADEFLQNYINENNLILHPNYSGMLEDVIEVGGDEGPEDEDEEIARGDDPDFAWGYIRIGGQSMIKWIKTYQGFDFEVNRSGSPLIFA